jgi:hypothetical protein
MRTRFPPKWSDDAQTVVSEEWLEQAKEATIEACYHLGNDPAQYFPEDYGKEIPDEGAWICVIEVPFTALEFDVPLLSMWRARRHHCSFGGIRIGNGVRPILSPWRPQQAVITTPGGDLHLWPHEYSIIENPAGLVGLEGVEIHTLGGEPVLPDDDDRLFYLMSRGISKHDAALILLGDMRALDFAYFTFPDDVVAALEGVGVPLWRYIQTHPRSIKPVRRTPPRGPDGRFVRLAS